MADPNEVTLIVGGQVFAGWTSVTVTRGIEVMPTSFSLGLTEAYPGQAKAVIIKPGDSCVVMFGTDSVVTGYIDEYSPGGTANSHDIGVKGRGRCQDLVDCSAGILPDGTFAMQINQSTALQIAQDLARPFGILVLETDTEAGKPINTFLINFGETPFEIIDRIARYEALLVYETTSGNLQLSAVGTTKMASGFQLGTNIESGQVNYSASQRFSEYFVLWTSTDTLTQERAATPGAQQSVSHGHVIDPQAGRFRPRAIVSEQTQNGVDIGQQRAVWEMQRRNGRSQSVTLTADNWRDSAGMLWQPNALALIDAPQWKVENQTWLITEVTFRKDANGLHADVTMMPKEAFLPEPTILQGIDAQVAADIRQGAAANTTSSLNTEAT